MDSPKLIGGAVTLALPVVVFFALGNYEANSCNNLLGLARQVLDSAFHWSCQLVSLGKWGALAAFLLVAGTWAYYLFQLSQDFPHS